MPQVSDTDSSITAGKNKLANICIFGQIKANSLMKDIAGQMPNNAKQLCRDLIAAAARVVRPDVTSDLIRDILHYRSRKVRSLLKEWKSGKLDTPLEQRLIECEKALLNTLELGTNMPTNFMESPEINSRSMEILSHMHSYIMDSNFRSLLIPTLPPAPSESRHHNNDSSIKPENEPIDVKQLGDQSDNDSVHASSSSFEDQCAPTAADPCILNYPEHIVLLEKSNLGPNNRRSSLNNGANTSSHPQQTKSMAGRKRKCEETQLEIIEMKKDLIRLQQVAFERQIQMCDEIVGMLKDMRGWMEIQKRASTIPQNSAVNGLPQLNSLPSYPLISNQLSSNLNTLTSLLAATGNTVTSPQFL